MSAFPIKRTPEQGHTRQCHARVMMLVVMEWATEDVTDFEYRTFVQDNGPLAEADERLARGEVECLCDPIEPHIHAGCPLDCDKGLMEVPC